MITQIIDLDIRPDFFASKRRENWFLFSKTCVCLSVRCSAYPYIALDALFPLV